MFHILDLVQYCATFLFDSGCSSLNYTELSQSVPMPHIYIIVFHVLCKIFSLSVLFYCGGEGVGDEWSTSLLSGTMQCSRFTTCVSFPILRISHSSNKPRFLVLMNKIKNRDVDTHSLSLLFTTTCPFF